MSQKIGSLMSERRPTLKLAATYLAVMMAMSILFSFILFFTSVHGFDKRPTSPEYHFVQKDSDHEIDEWLGRRAADNSSELAVRLVILNIAVLFVGASLSYFLARKTLQPIEKVMQEQERFIADASHELRTPLTSILLSNEVALRKKDLKVAEAKQLIKQNVEDMKELKALSDELLDVSIDKRVLRLEQHDLNTIVATAVNTVTSHANAKHIEVRAEKTDVALLTDSSVLSKILVILLDNSIKYSPSGTAIKIVCRAGTSGVEIAVVDQGMGIEAKEIDHIFERFYRVDASRTQTAGHGLGLSIATKLATKLGAGLAVKSTLGKGSTFTISLPL